MLAANLAIVNHLWVRGNLSHLPPSFDQAFYMYLGLSEYELASRGDLAGLLTFAASRAPWTAPLVPLSTLPFYAVFGPAITSAYLVNNAYMLVLLVSIFLIARRLGGVAAGAVAVLLCVGFPAFVAYPRDYLYEFPLAALAAAAHLLVLRSEGLRRRAVAIQAGVVLGLALLVKTMAVAFFVAPLAMAAAAIVRPREAERRVNAVLFLTAAAAVALPYYLWNLRHIVGYLVGFGFTSQAEPWSAGVTSLLSLGNWTVYARQIAVSGVSVAFAIIFVGIALSRFLGGGAGRSARGQALIWAWLATGYLLLSAASNKGGERYAEPILPAIAILAAVHLTGLRRQWLRRSLVAAAMLVTAANLVYQTASTRAWYTERAPWLVPVHHTFGFQRAARADPSRSWDPMVVLRAAEASAPPSGRPLRLLIGVNHWFLNYGVVNLYLALGRLDGTLDRAYEVSTVVYGDLSRGQLVDAVAGCDFVISKTGNQGPEFMARNCIALGELLADLPPVATFQMSDGSLARLHAGRRLD